MGHPARAALDELLAELDRAERVLPPAPAASTTPTSAFAVLGQLVARLRGGTWAEVLQRADPRPAGAATRTTIAPAAPYARGYLVDAYSDRRPSRAGVPGPRSRRPPSCGAPPPTSAAGRRSWPTPSCPTRAVLAGHGRGDGTAGRCTTTTAGRSGWGLGLILHRRGERVVRRPRRGDARLPGRARPSRRPEKVGARGAGRLAPPAPTRADWRSTLVLSVVDDDPELRRAVAARAGDVPAVRSRACSACGGARASQFVFSAARGALQARAARRPPSARRRCSREEGPDLLRAVSGRETGELLRLAATPTARSTAVLGDLPVTRDPRRTFDAWMPVDVA